MLFEVLPLSVQDTATDRFFQRIALLPQLAAGQALLRLLWSMQHSSTVQLRL
ncbi:hypothetical protein D3C81_1394920 [compost metagenome]